MPSKDFERRLQDITAKRGAGGSAQPTPNRFPATDRREKLRRALSELAGAGIKGNSAYAPLFRKLAGRGLIIKPLHFWSFLPLALFGLVAIGTCLGLGVALAFALGHFPRPVLALLEAGPGVFLAVTGMLGLMFAAYHKLQVRNANLPRWQDL